MTQTKKTPSFEQALTELEDIVRKMEKGDLPLDAAMAAYKRGQSLLKLCGDKLSAAEAEVQIMSGNGADETTADHHGPETDDTPF